MLTRLKTASELIVGEGDRIKIGSPNKTSSHKVHNFDKSFRNEKKMLIL